MRAITYARVSTDNQADSGAGLDAQRAAIAAAIAHRGWEVVAELVDEGRSGSTLNGRPALAQALGMLDRREAGALVVAKLDRLSRSVLDFASITELARRKDWAVVDDDVTTPTSELTANVTNAAPMTARRMANAAPEGLNGWTPCHGGQPTPTAVAAVVTPELGNDLAPWFVASVAGLELADGRRSIPST